MPRHVSWQRFPLFTAFWVWPFFLSFFEIRILSFSKNCMIFGWFYRVSSILGNLRKKMENCWKNKHKFESFLSEFCSNLNSFYRVFGTFETAFDCPGNWDVCVTKRKPKLAQCHQQQKVRYSHEDYDKPKFWLSNMPKLDKTGKVFFCFFLIGILDDLRFFFELCHS